MSGEAPKFARALSDLLADTLRKHEATAQPSRSAATVNTTYQILEEMEGATASKVQDFATQLLNLDTLPDSLRPMLETVGEPAHQWLGMVQQLFMWGVLMQLVADVLEPFTKEMENELWGLHPTVLLAPQEAASLKQRGLASKLDPASEAAGGGINSERFEAMVEMAARPPGASELMALWKRGEATEDEVKKALREGGMHATWIDQVVKLGVNIPTSSEVMNAWLEGQIEEKEAHKRFVAAGGDPTWFQTAFDANGEAPTPNMLGEMWKRGIIPDKGTGPKATTFEQGFLEGPWRNKWLAPMEQLMEYLPPPRTVSALYHEGSITASEAIELLVKQGLTHKLAATYVAEASARKTATQKSLAVTQVTDLYEAKAISESEAMKMWESLGYEHAEAVFIRELADLKRITSATTTAIATIHTEYTNHTIVKQTASDRLDKLHIPSTQRDELLALWTIERRTRVGKLTTAQIGDAAKKELITVPEALARWVGNGYTTADAGVLAALYVGNTAVSVSIIGKGIEGNKITPAEATSKLEALHYTPEDAALIIRIYTEEKEA